MKSSPALAYSAIGLFCLGLIAASGHYFLSRTSSSSLVSKSTARLLNPLRPTLTISPREDELDQEQFAKAKTDYTTRKDQALREQRVEVCDQLPDLLLPYQRDSIGKVQYISSQKDGPNVPERQVFWPRKQCIMAYALSHGSDVCHAVFVIPEERQDCLTEIQTAKTEEYQNLETLPERAQVTLGQKTFYSTRSRHPLPYFMLYPTKSVQGILIYVHGAGGGLEQGQLDGTYKDSFKKLKSLLKYDLSYIYVTPSLTDYGAAGGQDIVDLTTDLKRRFPDVPMYLAGSSAGGRTVFYTLKANASLFQGAIALCPAVDGALSQTDWKDQLPLPLWIIQGEQDQLVPVSVIDQFAERLRSAGARLTYERIPGDHGAPIDQVAWKSVLDSFRP